jgi:hypothetical protein
LDPDLGVLDLLLLFFPLFSTHPFGFNMYLLLHEVRNNQPNNTTEAQTKLEMPKEE